MAPPTPLAAAAAKVFAPSKDTPAKNQASNVDDDTSSSEEDTTPGRRKELSARQAMLRSNDGRKLPKAKKVEVKSKGVDDDDEEEVEALKQAVGIGMSKETTATPKKDTARAGGKGTWSTAANLTLKQRGKRTNLSKDSELIYDPASPFVLSPNAPLGAPYRSLTPQTSKFFFKQVPWRHVAPTMSHRKKPWLDWVETTNHRLFSLGLQKDSRDRVVHVERIMDIRFIKPGRTGKHQEDWDCYELKGIPLSLDEPEIIRLMNEWKTESYRDCGRESWLKPPGSVMKGDSDEEDVKSLTEEDMKMLEELDVGGDEMRGEDMNEDA